MLSELSKDIGQKCLRYSHYCACTFLLSINFKTANSKFQGDFSGLGSSLKYPGPLKCYC